MINPIEWYRKNMNLYVTSPYGYRTGTYAGFHQGVDLGGISCGTVIKTPFAGKVVAARTSGMGAWGNTIAIQISPDHIQLTAHHQKLLVKQGDIVKVGDPIATNGGTTHVGKTYSCHIHYEIRKNDGVRPWGGEVWGDPAKFYLNQSPIEPSKRFSVNDIIKNTANVNIRIRQNPSIIASIVGSVSPQEKVKITTHNNNGVRVGDYNWWFIGNGWIAEDFFELVTPVIPKPTGKFNVEDTIRNITQGNVRIRRHPSIHADIVDQFLLIIL
jgi:murein DD-endopeptidase MepM/ murein hydrolase activator NlpD